VSKKIVKNSSRINFDVAPLAIMAIITAIDKAVNCEIIDKGFGKIILMNMMATIAKING